MMTANRRARSLLVLIAIGAGVTRSAPASAQASGDAAAAEAAFDEGKRLMAQRRYAEACPKFAESNRLDPGIGILLYLGDCLDKNGQTASAWAAFREALAAAHSAGQAERERTARDRAAALESRLVRLTIVVPAASDVPGLEVLRDGVALGRPLWGSAVPVDPGRHAIEARAPGHKTWTAATEVTEAQRAATVTVPALDSDRPEASSGAAAAKGGASASAAPPADASGGGASWSTQKTVALIAGGMGIAGVGVGTYFGLRTISLWNQAKQSCQGTEAPLRCPTGDAYDAGNQASTTANISDIAFIGGGVALAAAVALWVTAPKATGAAPKSGRSAVRLHVDPIGRAVGASGTF